MLRNYKPVPKKHWTSKTMEDVQEERKAANTSIRDLSKKYNIPRSSLNRHLHQSISSQDRKLVR